MKIRKTELSDSLDIFQWRNNHSTRNASINNKRIHFDEHSEWFSELLENKRNFSFIGFSNFDNIGVCHLTPSKNSGGMRVSILLNPKFKNKGFGQYLLSLSLLELRKKYEFEFIAEIKKNNIPSVAIFQKIGFKLFSQAGDVFFFKLANDDLLFKPISLDDWAELYELLQKRKYNISHEIMPNINEHKQFVANHPYLHWYLAYSKNTRGCFYIKADNSVAINPGTLDKKSLKKIITHIQQSFYVKEKIASVVPSYFFINVPSDDRELINSLDELGLKNIQVSYRLT